MPIILTREYIIAVVVAIVVAALARRASLDKFMGALSELNRNAGSPAGLGVTFSNLLSRFTSYLS
jgi:hypothetical protein